MPEKSTESLPHEVTELRKLLEADGVKRVHKRLSAQPGFEQLSLTTLYRWKNGEGRRSRIESALRALNRAGDQETLRLALPAGISLAPAHLLVTSPSKSKHAQELQALPGHHNLQIETTGTSTGGDALDLLVKGKADVALTAHDHVQSVTRCRRLCQISAAPLIGLVPTAWGPRDVLPRVGYLRGAAVPARLRELVDLHVIVRPKKGPSAFGKVRDIVAALRNGSIGAFLGLEPYVSQVESELGHGSIKNVPALRRSGMFGVILVDLVAHPSASPSALWAYLQCLRQATEFVQENKRRRTLVDAIAEINDGVNATETATTLQGTSFRVEALDVETLFQLVTDLLAEKETR